MPTIGFTELIIILVIVLLVFGAKSIPEIGKAVGDGIREFKKAQSGTADKSETDQKNQE